MSRDPFCGNCGYIFTGLTESSRCPECGKPIVEVLQRPGTLIVGRRYTSETRVFGVPLVQIALGPDGDERQGRARAIIAIGDVATGVLALGGITRGVIAIGGMAVGVVACGGLAVGGLTFAGVAVGLLAVAGVALGGVAAGGAALGYIVVSAGFGVGQFVRAGMGFGPHVIGGNARSSEAIEFFERMGWLFGRTPMSFPLVGWTAVAVISVAVVAFLVVLAGMWAGSRTPRDAGI